MSHRVDQPHEIEHREVRHDFDDDGLIGLDYMGHVGKAEHSRDWSTNEEVELWEQELDRREAARQRLGGFGFGAGHGV